MELKPKAIRSLCLHCDQRVKRLEEDKGEGVVRYQVSNDAGRGSQGSAIAKPFSRRQALHYRSRRVDATVPAKHGAS